MNDDHEIEKIKARLPDLMKSPELFIQNINWQTRTARVLHATRDFFRKQAFLDDRVLQKNLTVVDVPLSVLWRAMGQQWDSAFKPCHFIFHTGYCGSTLFSRLFDELPNILGIREPMILRPFAASENQFGVGEGLEMKADMEKELARVYALLSRTFEVDERLIIKTTSICTAIAEPLLGFNVDNRALALKIPLKTYLATLLTRDEQLDVQSFSGHSLLGIKKRAGEVDIDLTRLSPPQLVALNWLSIALDLHDLIEGPRKHQVYLLDFDKFWKDTSAYVKEVLVHFSLPHDDETVSRLLESEVFTHYSKEPGISYSVDTRTKILAESEQKNSHKIAEGLEYADTLTTKYPALKLGSAFVGRT